MRGIRLWAMIVLIAAVLILPAAAEQSMAEMIGADDLWNGVSPDVKQLLDNSEPHTFHDLAEGLFFILRGIASDAADSLKQSVHTVFQLFFTVILCRLVSSFDETRNSIAVRYAGALAVMSVCLTKVNDMVGIGKSTMGELADFTMALNPVMAAAAAASGSVSGAGLNYAWTVFFSNILLHISRAVIIPVIYGYLALGLTDTLLQEDRLKRLRELLGWCVEHILKWIVYAFTGCLAITGALSGVSDAAKLKAAKSAISGMIPVVGGIISGAADTVLAGAAVLKGTVGTFGLLVILAIFMLPFLKLSIMWFLVKTAAALGDILSSPLSGLLDTVSKAMGYLLAMTGSGALIGLLSCCCYLKAVQL